MIYLLDTNICIYVLNKNAGYQNIIKHIDGLSYDEVCISTITLAELEYGIAKSVKKPSNKVKLEHFLYQFSSLPFDDRASTSYGQLRSALEFKGTPIGPLDMLIAAHALSVNATIVTNNAKEFNRVAELQVENWLDF